MHSILLGALFLVLSPVTSIPVQAQGATPTEQPHNEFFSGVITELATDKITVLKAVTGKNAETRTFAITSETTVEGKLRLKARVTVRYARDPDGARALHIIVRASQKK